MKKNPILEELYDIRACIFTEHRDDLPHYLHEEFERSKSQGHPVKRINQRRVRRDETADAGGSNSQGQSAA